MIPRLPLCIAIAGLLVAALAAPAFGSYSATDTPPPSGTFTLHGRPLDILSDGHALIPIRARYYDAVNGRWLQRDGLGFADGPNLYESFRSNPARFVDPRGEQIEEIINLFLTGRFLSNEEIDLALSRGDGTLARTQSRLLSDIGNAVTALGDVEALLLVPRGFEQGFRQPAVESTTARFQSLIAGQVAAGTELESASSNLTLTTLFLGDITGATQLGEGLFGVDLATNEPLSGGESIRRAVQGGSKVVIIAAGPKALRTARARTVAVSTVRTRVLANIAESQRARTASRFEVFAARQRALAISRGGAAPVRAGQAGVAQVLAELKQAGFRVRGEQITIQTTAARTRLDLFVQASPEGGVIPGTALRASPLQKFFVEVKTGPTARLTRNQRLAIPDIEKHGGIPRGLKAEKALLVPGKQSEKFHVFIIRR